MNEFMNFITQLNKVKTKSDPEFTWLTDFSHYAFLSNGGAEEEKYLGFVSNLIGSYYELLLKPFVFIIKFTFHYTIFIFEFSKLSVCRKKISFIFETNPLSLEVYKFIKENKNDSETVWGSI